jgi:hypothetical protein
MSDEVQPFAQLRPCRRSASNAASGSGGTLKWLEAVMRHRPELTSIAILFLACSTTEHTAPLGGESAPPSTDPATGAAGGRAGSADHGDLCKTASVVRDGPTVREMALAEAEPTALGGVIQPGKYWLTRVDVFTGAGGSTRAGDETAQVTMIIGNGTLRMAEAEGYFGAGFFDEEWKLRTFRTEGSQLITTTACGTARNTLQRGYSVVGDELHVFPGAGRREIYTRQPECRRVGRRLITCLGAAQAIAALVVRIVFHGACGEQRVAGLLEALDDGGTRLSPLAAEGLLLDTRRLRVVGVADTRLDSPPASATRLTVRIRRYGGRRA